MRSIIFTGYSYKEDLYINILITETLPKFPPIYGAVYISEVPWVPLWGHKGDWLKYILLHYCMEMGKVFMILLILYFFQIMITNQLNIYLMMISMKYHLF